MDHWNAVAEDRLVLADLIAGLPPERLHGPSLCSAWTVRDVASHVLAMATTSKGAVLASYVRHGANFEATNDALAADASQGRSDEQLIEALRASAGARHTPPGLKAEGVFGELVTHLADIALATDRTVELPADHLTTTLAYLARRRKGNTRFTLTRHGRQPVLEVEERIRGIRLEATDVAWTIGEGLEVQGPALALAAAMAGRTGALDHLSGDGVAELRSKDR